MSPEINELLDRGIPADVTEPDFETLAGRGVRRRHTKRVGGVALVAALVVGVGTLVGGAVRNEAPVIGEEPTGEAAWVEIADAPLRARGWARTVVDGDRVLFWGGEGPVTEDEGTHPGGTFHPEVQFLDGAVYDARTDTWQHVPPPPIATRSYAAVELHGSEVVLWGGSELEPLGPGAIHVSDRQPVRYGDGAIHDLAQGTWEVIPAFPLQPRAPEVVRWDGAQLFVWGGSDGEGTAFADGAVWSREGGWRVIADFPLAARTGSFTAWDDDLLVVWGGGTSLDGAPGNETLYADGAVYEFGEDRWTVVPDGALAPRWTSTSPSPVVATTLLRDGRVLVAGGARTTPEYEPYHDGAWLDLRDLEAMAWQPIPDGPAEARFVQTTDTGAYAVDDSRPRSTTVWLYDLGEARWERVEGVGVRDPLVLHAGHRPVIGSANRVNWVENDRRWQPIAFTDGGTWVAPTLDDVRTVRFWYSVAQLRSGVVLWGGLSATLDDEGGYQGDDAEHVATGWFLPLPR